MILTALYDFALDRGLLEDPDYEPKRVDYFLRVGPGGALIGLEQLDRGAIKMVPRQPKRAGNAESGFLYDNAKFALGLGIDPTKKGAELQKAVERNAAYFAAYRQLIADAAVATDDVAILSYLQFLNRRDEVLSDLEQLRGEPWTGGEWLLPVFSNDTQPIHQRASVRQHWKALRTLGGAEGEKVRCLISGKIDVAADLHGVLKRVPGGQSMGTSLVSFNARAFESQRLRSGENAAVSRAAAEGYVTAFNYLLEGTATRRYRQGIGISEDAVLLFWAQRQDRAEDIFADLMGAANYDASVASATLDAPFRGLEPSDTDLTPFYAVTIGGNAARVVVRNWFQSTIGDVKSNIRRYFDDLRIGRRDESPLPLWRLLKAISPPGDRGLPPCLGGQILHAAFSGGMLPRTLLLASLTRLAIPPKPDSEEATHADSHMRIRCALIKATLSRLPPPLRRELSVSLDENNTSVPYSLGRLFAVIEKLQEEALGDINVTVRDRFFGSASSTPGAIFPRLLQLSAHHASKAERGKWFESVKGKIFANLPALPFPTTLSLEERGEFAVGYYHQREFFFQKRAASPVTTTPSNESAPS